MGAINARGVWVPSTGDGLLEAWATMASRLGTWMQVASTAAARAALNAAEAAGMGATTNNPIMFLVGSGVEKVAYMADGSKTSGKWNLAPLNRTGFAEDTASVTSVTGLAQFQMKQIIKSSLTAAPYDRVVLAMGQSYGRVTSGIVNLGLRIGSASDQPEARFLGGDASASAAVTNSGLVPANTAPNIILGAVGDKPGATSSVNVGSVDKHSRLVVIAFPISMAV